jgi:nitrate/nitrite transporter NarK
VTASLSPTALGLLTGLVLGVVAAFGGFGAFVLVAVLGGLGLLAGRAIEGRLDLGALRDAVSGRRSLT